MGHLYSRLPRKTSNSNPAVVTVSQLGSLQPGVSIHVSLPMESNTHM